MRIRLRTVAVCTASCLALAGTQALAQSANDDASETSADAGPMASNDIIVTATRKSEALSKVPISVAAFDTAAMEAIGAKQVDDLVRVTPGLNLDRSVTGANTISIRGISSEAGAGTTGVYVDDTPIQVRNLGYGSGTAFPEIFDLDRVEVLRGPQGTLFGAGSEGGTVRFIQARPNMNDWSVYARGELATTDHGEPSYEAGVAVGGPLVEDKIGFRGHVYYRQEGGYVDGIEAVVAPAASPASTDYPYSDLVDVTPIAVDKDINRSTALTARLAIEFRPTEWLTITPSINYQLLKNRDGGGAFWTSTSDIGDNDFSRVVYHRGDPATNPALSDVDMPKREAARDRFTLYAVAANIDLGGAELVSNTSFFDRSSATNNNFTYIDAFQFAGLFFTPPGYQSNSVYLVGQKNFVQEVRLQSTDSSSRFNWVVGAFYSHNKQRSEQNIVNNFVEKLTELPLFGGVADGDPFGPGSSAIENAFGVPLLNDSSYYELRNLTERQLAGFGQVEYEIVDHLKLIAGVRVSKNKLTLDSIFRGPLNNDNAPYGAPCPTGETCEVGSGTFAPVYPDTNGFKNSESAVTPKFSISYQATPDHLFYATVAKGFRPAGVNSRVPSNFCGADLAAIGYVDGNGRPTQPDTYGSDSVWSYEIGAKNRALGGRLNVDVSAYHIDWSNIQSNVFLPTCLYQFVDNLGKAKSEGFDLAVDVEPVDDLRLGATVGYNRSVYGADVVTPDGTILSQKGTPIAQTRPWRVSLYGQYDFNPFYVRADLSYLSREKPFGSTDPDSPQYRADYRRGEDYAFVNLRAGARFDGLDVSLFVDNVTNAAPIFGLNSEFNRAVYMASTIRPRTIGATVSWRM